MIQTVSATLKTPPKLGASAQRRLRLMYAALREGVELPPGRRWYGALAPLNALEREGVLSEVARLQTLSSEARSEEFLFLAAQIGPKA